MHVLITGGTGLIGQRLCEALIARGDAVTVLSRRPHQVPQICGPQVKAIAHIDQIAEYDFDAVINLAGAPIVDAAWTETRKKELLASRVSLTRNLVEQLLRKARGPKVFISGSAIGYYGNSNAVELSEATPSGNDFSAQLCRDWEAEAMRYADQAQQQGQDVRVVLLRTGLVLDPRGGVLKKMLLPFRLGLGGKLGHGRQWMSWIHHVDYLQAVLRLLDDEACSGPYNLVAPQPVSNATFTQCLAQVLRRPAIFSTPAFVLNSLLGERAVLLLEGAHIVPSKLLALRFRFQFQDLNSALTQIIHAE
ncbi:TIGR01777 family oxidoreductase [Undibacterium cyanobacteriorum]|uniref:TIGR01777 family oxidoreductase n=1 Tax=Undibacterium cyanobacteriorum TaxID=3073561 RepID=A0ABY9RFC8_9BURK|nr:TIGR01777 family oxidoreductase [Undibacterium sp. 20NA77.5]WMW79335.1 TIGR01777 family oxidoreductase [Undibacterium sp. 20NA77.5]